MSLPGKLAAFALRYTLGKSADKAVDALERHFADHSRLLPDALSRANDRAWQAVGLAVAGDTLFDRARGWAGGGDMIALRDQFRTFLASTPTGLEAAPADVRARACDELNRLRKASRLRLELDGSELAEDVRRFSDPSKLVAGAAEAVSSVADGLADAPHLTMVLRIAPPGGAPLLATAFLYFLRREVEGSEQLSRALTFDSLRTLTAAQERGFTLLADRTEGILDQFDVLFDTLAVGFAAVEAKLDAGFAVVDAANAKLDDIQRRLLRPGVSYATEDERAHLLHAKTEFRRNAGRVSAADWAKLGDAMSTARMFGDAGEAHEAAAATARAARDPATEAANHYKAYLDACDAGAWPRAFEALWKAVELEPVRYRPFDNRRYRPERVLGGGAFGTVFHCHDEYDRDDDDCPRPVAIKAFRIDALDRDLQKVFSEARVLKALAHPSIIGVIDQGFGDPDARARPYLILEYFAGQTLDQIGPLAADDFLVIACRVAEAVHAAHSRPRPIFHRDLKPSNVMVLRHPDGTWAVKVIDFGLAVRAAVARAGMSIPPANRSTRDRSVTGTIKYAPPEQTGELPGVEVGAYSDVYAFGKTCLDVLFRTTAPKSWDWRKLTDEVRGPLQELLERCTADPLEHRHKNFEPVLRRLAELDPAERADRERQEREAAEQKRRADEAERKRLADAESARIATEQRAREEAERQEAEWKRRAKEEAERVRAERLRLAAEAVKASRERIEQKRGAEGNPGPAHARRDSGTRVANPTPAELPPGCVVLLIRLSAGMTADVVTARGEIPAFVAARQLADELVEGLVNAAAEHALGPIDVAVLGYHTSNGAPQILSLLPTEDATPRLIPLAQVARLPAEPRIDEDQPKKWTVFPPCDGAPCSTDALACVYNLVSVWLTGRFTVRPPVVIHCASADDLDESYTRVAQSLGSLSTGYGPARLLHYVFEPGADPVPIGAWTAAPHGSPWGRLFAVSGALPEIADVGRPPRRALAVNDWDITDQWSAIFDWTWREEADRITAGLWTPEGAEDREAGRRREEEAERKRRTEEARRKAEGEAKAKAPSTAPAPAANPPTYPLVQTPDAQVARKNPDPAPRSAPPTAVRSDKTSAPAPQPNRAPVGPTIDELLALQQTKDGAAQLKARAGAAWPVIQAAALDPRRSDVRRAFRDFISDSDRVKEVWEEAVDAILKEDYRKWDARWALLREVPGRDEAKKLLRKLVASEKNEDRLARLPTDVRVRMRSACKDVELLPPRPLLVPVGLGELEPLLASPPDWAGYTAFVLLANDKLDWLSHVTPSDRTQMRKRAREFLFAAPGPAIAAYVHAARPYLDTDPAFLAILFKPYSPAATALMDKLLTTTTLEPGDWMKLCAHVGLTQDKWGEFLLEKDRLGNLLVGLGGEGVGKEVWGAYLGLLTHALVSPELISTEDGTEPEVVHAWERKVHNHLKVAAEKLTGGGARLALALPEGGVARLFAANNLLKWVDKPASAERDGHEEVQHACDTFGIDRLDLVRVAYKKGEYDGLELPEQNAKLEPLATLFRTCFPVDAQYHTARSAVTQWLKLSEECPAPSRAAFQAYFVLQCVPTVHFANLLGESRQQKFEPRAEAAIRGAMTAPVKNVAKKTPERPAPRPQRVNIRVDCPACKSELEIDEVFEGQEVECGNCLTVFVSRRKRPRRR